jgi:flagellar biosynthesis/type III secretory pathway protein FliH
MMDRDYRDGYLDGKEKGEEEAYRAGEAFQEAQEAWWDEEMELQGALCAALADAARLSMSLHDLHAICTKTKVNIEVCTCAECTRAREALERHHKGD